MQTNVPAGVVDDLLHKTTDVAVALGVVVGTEPGRSLVVVRVGLENATALTLRSDHYMLARQSTYRVPW